MAAVKGLGEDVHSYSNFSEILITHIYPHLYVDFNRHIVHGYTDLTVEKKKENVSVLRLDTKGLAIEYASVVSDNKETPLPWTIPQYHAALGSCLQVDISTVSAKTFVVRISYSTSPTLSGGIQWFKPEQTKGKDHPFVYTQFEAILARTMIPCQDIPAVKAPYTIEVTCPSPLVVACSGTMVGTAVSSKPYDNQEWLTYKFDQKMPIPSYLIAMACGAIKRKSIGPNSGVWAEEPLLDEAAHEFAGTEQFLETAQKVAGLEYVPLWSHYDLLILPGAFPYGGMENPCLTFVSSSLITGDRQLVDVVAHEIAHSWSGNLVSNSTWSDFWLNEGFTMYLERLILGELHGEKHRHLHALLGYQDLQKTITELKGKPEFTKLRPDMTGIDPDDAFGRVPYEKGFLLLLQLEVLVGGKDRMTEWLRKYFADFARKSLNTDQMVEHFTRFFPDVKVDWNMWFYGTGLPTSFDPMAVLDKTFSQCEALAAKWKAGGEGASKKDLEWDSAQTMCFIDILINENAKLSADTLKKMQDVYHFSETRNVEILIRWIMLNLNNQNVSYIFPVIEDFVSKHGRGVYLKPIYNTLVHLSTPEGGAHVALGEVKRIYQKNMSFYHSVITNTFNKILAQ